MRGKRLLKCIDERSHVAASEAIDKELSTMVDYVYVKRVARRRLAEEADVGEVAGVVRLAQAADVVDVEGVVGGQREARGLLGFLPREPAPSCLRLRSFR